VLVDEDGGNGDSLTMPKSLNHTKTSENTGRWGSRDLETRTRNKRSLERQRQNHRPLELLDGGDGDVGANTGDGMVVQHDNSVIDSLSSRMLYAHTNRALPRKINDAIMISKSSLSKRLPMIRKHRKRQASDMIMYRKDSDGDNEDDDDDNGNVMAESVDIVPLDSEHRIRVNLTIASDDDSARSPMYSLSLSLPRSDQVEPVKIPAVSKPVNSIPPSLQSPGAECDCFCPCLDQDDDEDDRMTTVNIVPTISSTFSPIDNMTPNTIWTTTDYSTTEFPQQTVDVISCPPPVLLFCDTGKSLLSHVYIRT